MKPRECLPVDQLLERLTAIERDIAAFYERARDLAGRDDIGRAFADLLAHRQDSAALVGRMCDKLKCGETVTDHASDEDLHFLTALIEGGFYRSAGRPAELAEPGLDAGHLLDNAVKLEKDLLLFYLKFHGLCCIQHRPLFSELIQRGQKHIGTLQQLRTRLLPKPGR